LIGPLSVLTLRRRDFSTYLSMLGSEFRIPIALPSSCHEANAWRSGPPFWRATSTRTLWRRAVYRL